MDHRESVTALVWACALLFFFPCRSWQKFFAGKNLVTAQAQLYLYNEQQGCLELATSAILWDTIEIFKTISLLSLCFLQNIVKVEPIQPQVYLSVSSLIHNYCNLETSDCSGDSNFRNALDYFESSLSYDCSPSGEMTNNQRLKVGCLWVGGRSLRVGGGLEGWQELWQAAQPETLRL